MTMYLDHFGLHQPPFRITPDTSLFYEGADRGDALEALVYTIMTGEGIVKVVGEVGSGKTMLCRMLETRLPEDVIIVYIANPSLSPDNILHAIALELNLDITHDDNKFSVMHVLQAFLLEQHKKNRRVVVFIEEAQGMPLETLEEIRLLTNLETGQNKLLQIVLFGQPELDENLSEASIRQLRERITHSFYLKPLKTDDTHNYLQFRLANSGYRGPDIFTDKAIKEIQKYAHGLVRRINLIADKAMMMAFSEGVHQIAHRHIKCSVQESDFGTIKKPVIQGFWNPLLITSIFLLTLSSALFLFSLQQPSLASSEVVEKPDGINLIDRIEATREWLNHADPSHYTIQLMSVRMDEHSRLERYLDSDDDDLNKRQVYVYQTRQRGEDYFGVLYAEFKSMEEGIRILNGLPIELKNNKPFLRSVKAVQQEQFTSWKPSSS